MLAGSQPCLFEACDMNGDGRIDFDDINPFVEILATGGGPCPLEGVWLGPGTSCDECCWVPQPPGSILEGEERCLVAYVDHLNGGCDSTPPVFQPLACGQTLYGHGGSRWANQGRDTDWFTTTLAAPGVLRLTWESEFLANVYIMRAGSGPHLCDPNDPQGYRLLVSAIMPRCGIAELTTGLLPAGEYWIEVAALGEVSGGCLAHYALTVNCDMFAGGGSAPEAQGRAQ